MNVRPLVALALVACGSSAPPTPPVRPGEEADRFTDVTVPGLTLWRVHGAVPDHEWSSIVGMDAEGHVVPSTQVFLRVLTPGMPVETVATRAQQILGIGGGLLHTGSDSGGFGSPEEKALVVPPSVTDGVLTMWMTIGEMVPTITRVRVTLATGAVTREGAYSIAHANDENTPSPTASPFPTPKRLR